MDQKHKESFRNPQDIIDHFYNARDFTIVNKDMNSYVMPLNMMRDVDAFDSRKFYVEEWSKIIDEINRRRGESQ